MTTFHSQIGSTVLHTVHVQRYPGGDPENGPREPMVQLAIGLAPDLLPQTGEKITLSQEQAFELARTLLPGGLVLGTNEAAQLADVLGWALRAADANDDLEHASHWIECARGILRLAGLGQEG